MSESLNRVPNLPPVPEAYLMPFWYAVYTRPRHEKSVADLCRCRGVETFLPLYSARRRWKERYAEVQLPLFPSYVFVRLSLQNRLRVLTIPSVVSFVTFHGVPAVLPDAQVEALSNAIRLRKVEPATFLAAGKKVRVLAGPLTGLEGIVLRRKNAYSVIVSIDWMSRSVAVPLEAADLEALSDAPRAA